MEHLEAKIGEDVAKLHPLIDEFILTLEDDGGICHTHPEKLPGNLFSINFTSFLFINYKCVLYLYKIIMSFLEIILNLV